MKFALLSEVIPPSWSGQAVLIRRLVAGLDPSEFCLLTSDQGDYGGAYTEPLAARCYRLPRARIGYIRRKRSKLLFGASALVGAGTAIALRALYVARAARRERCDALIAFTGDFHDLPGAFFASRLLRIPLYIYMCDYYSQRELYEPARRVLAGPLERVIVPRATRVICGTETLADALRDRYGIDPAVIHHPADLSLYDTADRSRAVPTTRELRIVYTGTIYHAQLDAVLNLVAALDLLDERPAALHVYGGQTEADLQARGLTRRLAVHTHAPATAIATIQQAADVLFLPLAFQSQYPEVIRTSAPMKFGEYLAAGGPILAHAPPGSFVAEYCRRYDCAAVVDESDPARLAHVIEVLASDAVRRGQLVANARERAAIDFGIDVARSKFSRLLQLDPVQAPT